MAGRADHAYRSGTRYWRTSSRSRWVSRAGVLSRTTPSLRRASPARLGCAQLARAQHVGLDQVVPAAGTAHLNVIDAELGEQVGHAAQFIQRAGRTGRVLELVAVHPGDHGE